MEGKKLGRSIYGKKFRLKEAIIKALLFFCSLGCMALFLGISFFLIKNGLAGLNITFFTSSLSILKGVYGIRDYLVHTVFLVILTLVPAAAVGVLGAVYLCEYAGEGKTVKRIHFAIEILTGIPSILFGLFGMVLFGEGLGLGYSLLTGSLTLSLMVLPLIIENTIEMLETVPKEYREGALGLGAGKWHMVRTILLPFSIPGIAAGITLSVGKILGESAALLLTAGSGSSLAVALYMAVSRGRMGEAFSIGLSLLVLSVLLNLLIQYIRQQAEKNKNEW